MKKIPFSEEELKEVGRYYVAGRTDGGKVKLNTPVSPLENMMAFLNNETPCWMPDGDIITVNPEIIPDNVARAFVQEENPTDKKGGPDMFGVEWIYDPRAGGSMVRPGTPLLSDVNDWKEVIRFPDVDSWDWEGSARRNEGYVAGNDPIWTVQFSGLFERLISFMDFEYAAMALIDEDQEDAVKALFQALTDTYIKILDHCIDAYHINGYLFHDDWGSQRSPFFSKNTWLEMIAPYVKQLVDHCHARNVIFELHSCGCTETMIDVISSIGIDMWRPQPMNNIKKMYDEYGDKIKLGIRAPLFPAGTPAEVEIQAAKDMLALFNTPGKFVFTNNFMESDVFRRALYEESRKMYLQQP